MMTVWGHDHSVADFVSHIIWKDDRGFSDNYRAMGILDKGGVLVGGIVYHNYDPDAGVIEWSAGATTPKWLTPNVVKAAFAYPFHLCKCQMLMARTEAKNRRTRRLLCGIGFSEQKVERLFGRNSDGILLTLTDDEWKAGIYHTKEFEHGEA